MNLGDNLGRALRPDAQAFDEVRIVTVPRYKQSGLSGDEWRISAQTQFWRKGVLRHTVDHGTIEAACGCVYADFLYAVDGGHAYFAGEGTVCDQEGCQREATTTYRLKQSFCKDGHATIPFPGSSIRMFCDVHKTRGNCGLSDADRNYEVIT